MFPLLALLAVALLAAVSSSDETATGAGKTDDSSSGGPPARSGGSAPSSSASIVHEQSTTALAPATSSTSSSSSSSSSALAGVTDYDLRQKVLTFMASHDESVTPRQAYEMQQLSYLYPAAFPEIAKYLSVVAPGYPAHAQDPSADPVGFFQLGGGDVLFPKDST